MMKARVNTYLNIRTGKPEVLPGNNPNDAYYKPGDEIEIAGTITGEEYKGNNKWYKLPTGVFVWSGGVDDPNGYPWWITDFGINEIWEYSRGKGVTVVLLDSGLSTGPDVTMANISAMRSVLGDIDGTDTYGHGTLMSSVICGSGPDFYGVAPDVRLISIKICDGHKIINQNFIKGLEAIKDIAQQPDKKFIVNCSVELNDLSESEKCTVESLIGDLVNKGIIFSVAAGNDSSIHAGFLPGLNSPVISSAGISKDNRDGQFFRLGDSNIWGGITITSPGDFSGFHGKFPFEQVLYGSSHACAYTTGIIALLLSVDPGMTCLKIKETLKAFSCRQTDKFYPAMQNTIISKSGIIQTFKDLTR